METRFRRLPHLIAVLTAAGAIVLGCASSAKSEDLPLRHTGHYATIETERGNFVIEPLSERRTQDGGKL